MVLGVLRCFRQTVDNRSRSRQIWITNPEIDDIDSTAKGLLLHLIDRGKQIGRQRFDACGDFDRKTGHSFGSFRDKFTYWNVTRLERAGKNLLTVTRSN